jgi:hypothetical protein
MDNFFRLSILLIPISTAIIVIISSISTFYEFIEPKLVRLKTHTTATAGQSKIYQIKKQIDEVEKYQSDHNLLVKTVLREILWAFCNIFVACIAIAAYYLTNTIILILISRYSTKYLYILQSAEVMLQSFAILFFLLHFNKSLKQVFTYYQLVKNVIDYNDYIKIKKTEINHLKQSLKKLSKQTSSKNT